MFNNPIKALNDVLCSGFYYGDGSHLTNLPIVNDPSKLPLAGGTMTGPIVMSLSPAPVVVNTLTNEHVEIIGDPGYVASIAVTTPTTPQVYLASAGGSTLITTPLSIDITVPGVGNNYLTTTGGTIVDSVGSNVATNTVDRSEYFNPSVHNSTYCRVGSTLGSNWSGLDVRTGFSSEYSASLGFYSSLGQTPTMQLTTPDDSATLTNGALLAANPAQLSTFTFAAPDMFFKWDAGTSFKIDIDDHHVSRDMAFKVINGPSGTADFQNYEYYLEQPNLTAGWSIIISEGSGLDATITNPDGIWFYGYGIPGYTQQSTFQLKKWSTARITLVPSIVFAPGYAWAVSMY
jgi:archaellum component FlaG (FlaF/FlaG flagellin family)